MDQLFIPILLLLPLLLVFLDFLFGLFELLLEFLDGGLLLVSCLIILVSDGLL